MCQACQLSVLDSSMVLLCAASCSRCFDAHKIGSRSSVIVAGAKKGRQFGNLRRFSKLLVASIIFEAIYNQPSGMMCPRRSVLSVMNFQLQLQCDFPLFQ